LAVRNAQPTRACGGWFGGCSSISRPCQTDYLSWPFQPASAAGAEQLVPALAELPLSRVERHSTFSTFFEVSPASPARRHAPQLGTFPSSNHNPRVHLEHPATCPAHQTATMDSDSVKKAIIKQALQATNTANARTLIEVRTCLGARSPILLPAPAPPGSLGTHWPSTLTESPEHQREVLRALRPQAGQLPLERREDMPYIVHGEVHGGMERGQCDVHPEDTAGDWQPGPFLSSSRVVRHTTNLEKPRGCSCTIGDRRQGKAGVYTHIPVTTAGIHDDIGLGPASSIPLLQETVPGII
jgi:hypothetical protein